MCKEGWYVGLWQGRLVCVSVGESIYNTMIGDGIEKRRGETKILERGQAGSRDECL